MSKYNQIKIASPDLIDKDNYLNYFRQMRSSSVSPSSLASNINNIKTKKLNINFNINVTNANVNKNIIFPGLIKNKKNINKIYDFPSNQKIIPHLISEKLYTEQNIFNLANNKNHNIECNSNKAIKKK